MSERSVLASNFSEKEFYLGEFRGKTLLFALPGALLPEYTSQFEAAARELVANGTRLIVLFGGLAPGQAEVAIALVAQCLEGWPGREGVAGPLWESPAALSVQALAKQAWLSLRSSPLFSAVVGDDQPTLARRAATLASRLKVHKLVMLNLEGGLKDELGALISFTNAASMRALLKLPTGSRSVLLQAALVAVEGGVSSASICSPEGLSGELFSYEGTGTLCTARDYCLVERVGIDDFREVEKFIKRGQEEGFLKPRSDEEIAELLPNTWGAVIGNRRLAGVCALETYHEQGKKVGEVAALSTVSRFKGEGIGSRLLTRVIVEARKEGMAYIFACTTKPQVVAFFVHNGFRVVTPAELPAAKWEGYDAVRQRGVVAVRREL